MKLIELFLHKSDRITLLFNLFSNSILRIFYFINFYNLSNGDFYYTSARSYLNEFSLTYILSIDSHKLQNTKYEVTIYKKNTIPSTVKQ